MRRNSILPIFLASSVVPSLALSLHREYTRLPSHRIIGRRPEMLVGIVGPVGATWRRSMPCQDES
jgi:hypothetical protein